MDPTNPGPEEYVYGYGGAGALGDRPPAGGLPGRRGPVPARTVRIVSGDFAVTVNPVDGSEIEPCPPGERPPRPVRRGATRRAELARDRRPPAPSGPALPPLLLDRAEERERIVRLLARGRSVRLTGPSGSGRTVLLDAVAEDCADLAPDGVVRLTGYRRTARDLLHDLFNAVYDSGLYRPDYVALRELVRGIGAVVVLDDLEFGGSALDELLDATPECAFVFSATPEVAPPSAGAHLEEVFLGGLGRTGGMELLRRAAGRPLTDEETQWVGDLWFESEGLPVRFVQAGALLRRRDQLRAEPGEFDAFGYYDQRTYESGSAYGFQRSLTSEDTGDDGGTAGDGPRDVPLPSFVQGAAPAVLLASGLSESARAVLQFAVALGGEVPHPAQLPALIGDTHADAALAELRSCALITPVGGRHRLVGGVQTELEAAGFGDTTGVRVHAAAQHYAWWAGHQSVAPARVLAESDAVLAALSAMIARGAPAAESEGGSLAVRLARTAAPAFAAGLDWGAWERALRSGQEAARLAGEVAEEAYFHHELGVLALCGGRFDRARAELEASIGLRGALADKRGMVAGRRALALLADRSGGVATPPAGALTAGAGPVGALTAGPSARGGRYRDGLTGQPVPPAGVPARLPAPRSGFPELPASPGPRGLPALPGPSAVTGPPVPSGVSAFPEPAAEPDDLATLVGRHAEPESGGPASDAKRSGHRRAVARGTRRNLVAAGAGAVLVAVLGTVVTLGATSDRDSGPSGSVDTNPSTSSDDAGDGGITADEPPVAAPSTDHSKPGRGASSGTPKDASADATTRTPGAGTVPRQPGGEPSSKPSSGPTKRPTTSPTRHPTKPPTTKPPTTKPPTTEPTETPGDPSPSDTPTDEPTDPDTSVSASGPVADTTTAGPVDTEPASPGA